MILILLCLYLYMKKPIISLAQQKREDSFLAIKKEFESLMSVNGSQKTAVIKHIAKSNKISTATIYKAIK